MDLGTTPSDLLQRLSQEQRQLLAQKIGRIVSTRRLYDYRPYEKQRAFHAAGLTRRERLLRAGNQLGKTWAGGAEAAYHLTGKYPDWWAGRRFDKPTVAWVGGPSGETVRDNAQRVLLGRPKQHGTGMIPGADLVDTFAARGVQDLADYAVVRHVSGELSTVKFKTYDQGRERWQGETLDFVWFDEEPDQEIYTEGLTRTNATRGLVFLTFTPLLGMSDVVMRFLTEQSPDRHDTNLTIEDAEHIPPEERARIIASYPAHEREARTMGTPILGSGRIFPVEEAAIKVEPFPIPAHYALLGAMDFGWDHPFAAVKLAYDRDVDCLYVTSAYRIKEATPAIHSDAIKAWGAIPWAWPHDGFQHDKGSGVPLAKQYRDRGLDLMADHATFEDGSVGVEAGLQEMLDRMQTGRLKVFSNLSDWFEEFRLYHRKDGKVVKERDDLMSATRYGVMMKRHAKVLKPKRNVDRSAHGAGAWMG